MIYDNLRAFQKHLEAASPHHLVPVYLILSKDPSLCKIATESLLQAVFGISKDNTTFNIRRFDGEKVDPSILFNELNGISFFKGPQVVILKNGDQISKPLQKQLEAYFNHPNPRVIFVITASSFAANTNFYKFAEKTGVILKIEELKGNAKTQSLMEYAFSLVTAQHKTMDSTACRQLVNQVGEDRELLQNELNKLCCYVGERTAITSEDIQLLCASINQETIWQLGEAIFKREITVALRISKALLDEGTSFFALLKQIRNQFQTDFQVCSILKSGGDAEQVTKLFPYMKGFILNKHIQSAQAYGWECFRNGLLAIDETDLFAKNSSIDKDLLMEKLIINLAS